MDLYAHRLHSGAVVRIFLLFGDGARESGLDDLRYKRLRRLNGSQRTAVQRAYNGIAIRLLDRIGDGHGGSGTLIKRGAVHRIVHDVLRYKRTGAVMDEDIFCIAPDLDKACQCGFCAGRSADNDLPGLGYPVFPAKRGGLFERFEPCYNNNLIHAAAAVQCGERSRKHRHSGKIHKELVLAHPRGSSGGNDNDAARGIFCLAKKIRKSTHRFYSLRFFRFRRH